MIATTAMNQTPDAGQQAERPDLGFLPSKIKSRDGLLGKRITEFNYIPRGDECQ
jgi:hypothetical protein